MSEFKAWTCLIAVVVAVAAGEWMYSKRNCWCRLMFRYEQNILATWNNMSFSTPTHQQHLPAILPYQPKLPVRFWSLFFGIVGVRTHTWPYCCFSSSLARSAGAPTHFSQLRPSRASARYKYCVRGTVMLAHVMIRTPGVARRYQQVLMTDNKACWC